MIIDCHNHPDWHGHDLTKFLANMDEHEIDVTWLLSWECPRTEWSPQYTNVCPMVTEDGPIPFSRCLYYKERCPDRFVLGYAPDPRRPDAIDLFDGMMQIHGVKVYGEIKLRMCYDNPDALRMFRFCGEKGAPVTVHIDYELGGGKVKYPRPNWWYGGGMEAFVRAVKACPDTVFLGHAPGFWAHISGDDQFDKVGYPKGPVEPGGRLQEVLDECPNLYCDISAGSGRNAFERDPEHAKQFIERYQDRILFGRDYFDGAHRAFLDGLGLSRDILDKIYFKNALKLVPIEE